MNDVKMSEPGDVSSTKLGEVSSSNLQELLKKYSRKSKAEDSSISLNYQSALLSIKENSTTTPSPSLSSSHTSSSASTSFPSTPAASVLALDSKPPYAYSSRITPRPRKTSALTATKIKFFQKGVQVNLINCKNYIDENTPPGSDYIALKKKLQETETLFEKKKKDYEYLLGQVKRMQEETSLKAVFSGAKRDTEIEELKNRIIELEKKSSEVEKKNIELQNENSYITNQVKKMQETSSMQSGFCTKEHYSGAMGKYTICNNEYDVWKKPVGRGASCMVFKGFDKSRDDMVAIKVVSLQRLNPKNKKEMQREIELLKSLKDEDCIINLFAHEFKLEHCRLSLVLEYGEMDLHTYLQHTPCLTKSPGKQSYYEVCLLWQQMLHAVQCIHSHNIVHKDLKPQNFMKVKGKLKLIDFGISETIQDEVTSMIIQQPEGTPNYIAPEMLSGTFGMAEANVLGYRSDVYSLGCILYKMCFGVTPYQHVEKMQMKYLAIISNDPIRIPEGFQYPDIARVLDMCLQKDRTKRPTVAQLMEM